MNNPPTASLCEKSEATGRPRQFNYSAPRGEVESKEKKKQNGLRNEKVETNEVVLPYLLVKER